MHTIRNCKIKGLSIADSEYLLVKEEVKKVYSKYYNANIDPTPELFVYLQDLNNKNISGAAFGLTKANNRTLFSERYLGMPVNTMLLKKYGVVAERELIAELSSVAAINSKGLATYLLSFLPIIMHEYGIKYILITCTKYLFEIIKILRLPYYELISANKHLMSYDEQIKWGSYYETEPVVCIMTYESFYYSSFLHSTGKNILTDVRSI